MLASPHPGGHSEVATSCRTQIGIPAGPGNHNSLKQLFLELPGPRTYEVVLSV